MLPKNVVGELGRVIFREKAPMDVYGRVFSAKLDAVLPLLRAP
jgi:hypothetical protein